VRRTKEDSQRTRQQILGAARSEFARRGVTRTTMQHIAGAAGVSRGAVYWHFANKRELFRTMREQVTLPLFDRSDVLADDSPDPLGAIERFLRGMIDQIGTDRVTRRTFEILALKCEYVDEFRSELLRHTRRCHELMDRFAKLYRRAHDVGALREDIAPATAALGTCVFVTGLLRLWLMDERSALVRPEVDALIAGHMAMLRTPAGVSVRLRSPGRSVRARRAP
jgi:TetR/AcrR family transcriptional regulator, acrAB operon repressor